jgi:hypothetical protein
VCRQAESRRKRDQRERKLTGGTVTALPTATTQPPRGPGEVELAVVAEVDGLPMAADRPALVANAITLAGILDNAEQVYMWPQTTRQLHALLNELHGGGKRKRRDSGRLASVSQMVGRNRIATQEV